MRSRSGPVWLEKASRMIVPSQTCNQNPNNVTLVRQDREELWTRNSHNFRRLLQKVTVTCATALADRTIENYRPRMTEDAENVQRTYVAAMIVIAIARRSPHPGLLRGDSLKSEFNMDQKNSELSRKSSQLTTAKKRRHRDLKGIGLGIGVQLTNQREPTVCGHKASKPLGRTIVTVLDDSRTLLS